MAYPKIVFDAGVGSDTDASGAGPTTAITGADASTDAAGTTITLPNADLSGILVDGSHVLFLRAPSGRKFAAITGKGDDGLATAYVTVTTAYGASLSALSYAIGGKRATWDHGDSRLLWSQDGAEYWTIETKTDQVLTSAIQWPGSTGGMRIQGDAPYRVVTQTLDGDPFWSATSNHNANEYFRNLQFLIPSGNSQEYVYWTITAKGIVYFVDCVAGDPDDSTVAPTSFCHRRLYYGNCAFVRCAGFGLTYIQYGAWNSVVMIDCFFRDIAQGTYMRMRSDGSEFRGCVFVNCGTAIEQFEDNTTETIIEGCTFFGCAQAFYARPGYNWKVRGNQIINCSVGAQSTGGELPGSIPWWWFENYANNYWGNGTDRDNWPADPTDTAKDPEFAGSANGDYTPGASFAGYPETYPLGAASLRRRVGAFGSTGGGGGGAAKRNPFRSLAFGG